jgi:myo-inositol catabolism protein IolC
MLAFDHRGSFQKQLLGIPGVPTREQAARISDTKASIFEGFLAAHASGKLGDGGGILVDEEFGTPVARRAKEMGVVLAMPAEASGRDEFEQWLRAGAGVPGYRGFAVGRTIWWDALVRFRDGKLSRADAATLIATNYMQAVDVYRAAAS